MRTSPGCRWTCAVADEEPEPAPPPPGPQPYENPRPAVMAKVQLWVVAMWRMDHPEGTSAEALEDLTALLSEAITAAFT
jgi:hypothetical protein